MILPHAQFLSSPPPILILPKTQFLKPCLSLPAPPSFTRPLNINRSALKCRAASLVSEPPQLELSDPNRRPFPAEITRTVLELSSVGTLSTLSQDDGSPLGFGVRFALDFNGTPILCLSHGFSADTKRACSLHVKLEQCGVRTPQCTIVGNLDKPGDAIALKKLCSAWKKRFNEEVEESCVYVIDVERVLQIEDYGEDGVWVSSSEYVSAEPDPLRNSAEKIVDEINTMNREDVLRFCNIYADLDFQVVDAKMVWVDRLGFDVRVASVQNDVYEVRIPFPREVGDEKGAKSSFNGMSQLAWEVEKNFHALEFKKVKHVKKVGNAVQTSSV